MALQIEGGLSGVKLDGDTDKQAFVKLSGDMSKAGYAMVAARADDGDFLGSTLDVNVEADADYRMRVAIDSLAFRHTFDGIVLDSGVWSHTATTMTATVAAGFVNLNAGASAATSVVSRLTSYRTFDFSQAFAIFIDVPLQISAASAGIANTTWEVGFGIASGTTEFTDGIFMRCNAAGEFRLCSVYNGTLTQSNPISLATVLPDGLPVLEPNTDRQFVLEVTSHQAKLWCNDILIATLEQSGAVPAFAFSQSLPATARIYNGATPPATATTLKIGTITVSYGGRANAPDFVSTAALSGCGADRTQSGNATPAQLANWTNNTVVSVCSLSNTTPSYSTLGGQFVFAAPAGSDTADYALFGYQVPAAAAGSMNRNLLIRRIVISSVNVGAAVATTATVFAWGVAVGSTAASLATTEAATTRAPRRMSIGMQSWIVGAAIGAAAPDLALDLSQGPLLCEPGSYVHIIARVIVGTATGSQQIRGAVAVVGQFVLCPTATRAGCSSSSKASSNTGAVLARTPPTSTTYEQPTPVSPVAARWYRRHLDARQCRRAPVPVRLERSCLAPPGLGTHHAGSLGR